MRQDLKMQSAHNTARYRQRMIILHEAHRDAERGPSPLIERLGKAASLVPENGGRDQFDVGND
jgi:hypothetical protein